MFRNQTMISVIIPVYNVCNYLSQCVESVLAACSRFCSVYDTGYEILLIDDGSTDYCSELCDAFAFEHSEVVAIHKQNSGQGPARNIGLNISTGEYISFVDSDDMISDSMYCSLMAAMRETESDVAVCDSTKDVAQLYSSNDKKEMLTFFADEAVLSCIYDGEIRDVVWDKLYKRNVVNDLLFSSFEIGEDVYFLFQALGNAHKIVKIKKKLYFYRQHDESIMNASFSPKWLGALDAKEARHGYIVENMPVIADDSAMVIINTCIYDGQCAYKYLKGKQLYSVIHRLSKTIKKYRLPKRIISGYGIKRKIWLRMARISLPVTCWLRYKLNVGF